MWVLNLTVVNSSSAAAGCTTPHNCDLATVADRAALFSNFGTLQTLGGGAVQQEPSGFTGTPEAGFTYILAQTDGSLTGMKMNGRGLTCTPGCDATTSEWPNATDYFVAYKITDTGTHNIGDSLLATAAQDLITLDSIPIVVVGPPTVGGIAEQPDVASLPPAAASSGLDNSAAYIVGGILLATIIGAGGWYVRRKQTA